MASEPMPAGEELDRIVAEAMGWIPHSDYNDGYWETPTGKMVDAISAFSTDSAQVGPMCEHLRKFGYVKIHMGADWITIDVAPSPAHVPRVELRGVNRLPHALALAVKAMAERGK